MRISVVSTLYRSAGTVEEFCRRALAAAAAISDDIELVLVNDGSPDDSLERAVALHAADPRIVVVDLSRNFGHHKAMMTGLAQARGDLIFLLDSDLEEEPELLTKFHQRMEQEHCDVVYGVQEQRRGTLWGKVVGELSYRLGKVLSDDRVPRNVVTMRLMTRDYVRALVRHRDREFLFVHLCALAGFRQVALPIQKRSSSPTTYSLRQRIEMAINHTTTIGAMKLPYYVLYAGLGIVVLSLAAILYLVARYFLAGAGVDGWTSLLLSLWFLGGSTILVLGILGIYLANILAEARRRPYTVVRQVYRATEAAQTAPPKVQRGPIGSARTDILRMR